MSQKSTDTNNCLFRGEINFTNWLTSDDINEDPNRIPPPMTLSGIPDSWSYLSQDKNEANCIKRSYHEFLDSTSPITALDSKSNSQLQEKKTNRGVKAERSYLDEMPMMMSDNQTYPNGLTLSIISNIRNQDEQQYLDLVKKVLLDGIKREDRTGTGTISIFGAQMRFNLADNRFPLLTTKRVFWRGVAEELLWMISGCTNSKKLSEKGITIWDANGSREFLDKQGLTNRQEGDLGPVYGFQWRHFGAKYKNCNTDYKGQGFDQLADCINKIKTNPNDRRIVMSAWNPSDLKLMALPPCHMFCQFYVADGKLSCLMYQRSADLGLGVPFNIASYALLTILIANICKLVPGEFIHSIGDAHIYLNHIGALEEQVKRIPTRFPMLILERNPDSIDHFKFKDFVLVDYTPQEAIKMEMAL